jgi:ABC-type transporter Mla MlaB component
MSTCELRMFTVVVPSTGGTFELGEALATASVTIKRGRTERAQDSQVVQVQPTVFVDLADTARLESGGGAVLIDVTVACPVGANGRLLTVNVS